MTLEPSQSLSWHKSSFSGGGNGGCVEVAWRKSSFSGAGNGGCVEVAWPQPHVAVRDSKDPDGPRLTFPHVTWKSLIATI